MAGLAKESSRCERTKDRLPLHLGFTFRHPSLLLSSTSSRREARIAPERQTGGPWLDYAEAAAYTSSSRRSLERATAAGHLKPGKSANGKNLYHRRDLDRWIKRGAPTLVLLVVVLAAVYLGCRAGFHPAERAVGFILREKQHHCAPGKRSHHRHHRLYVLGADRPTVRQHGVRSRRR